MSNGARIESPEILKAFRPQLIKFNETCHNAVNGVRTDMHRASQWLRQDQANYWKRELRKAEESVIQCRAAYNEARYAPESMRKTSAVDEKKALERAIRRKEECDQKTAAVKRWSIARMPASVLKSSRKKTTPRPQIDRTAPRASISATTRIRSTKGKPPSMIHCRT